MTFAPKAVVGPKPEPTLEMQLKGLEWVAREGEWKIVCSTCKGNCGQCGLTGAVTNVESSIEAIASAWFPSKSS